jgi:tetratricopeptide (TPR) repeat protein
MRSSRVLVSVLAVAAVAVSACAGGPGSRVSLNPARRMIFAGSQGNSAYGLYLAGEAALDSGASDEAVKFLSRASQRAPDAAYVRQRAFTAALMAGDIAKASELAPGPEESSPAARALGRLVRAVEALAEDRGRDAYAALNGPQTDAGAGGAGALLKPWAAAAAGDWKTALAPPDPKDQAATIFGAFGRALLLERAGRANEAEAIYKAYAADKAGVFALGYGAFLERRGRGREAVAVYDIALAQSPDTEAFAVARARAVAGRPPPPAPSLRQGAAQALIGPAALLLAQRQNEVGVAFLRLALRLDPEFGEAWVLIGDSQAAAGDLDGARAAYRKVRPASSEYGVARGRLALSLAQGGDKPGALALARETVQAAPNDPQALSVLADLLTDAARYDEAVKVLDQLVAATRDGPNAWRYLFLRGAALERAGRWEPAQADLQRALKLKPDEPEVLNYLGFAWVDRGEHLREGLQLLEKAVALKPESGAIIDSLGWAHYRLGQYDKAVREVEKAASLDPGDPEINDHLGDVYWRIGRRLEAEYQWRRVLTLEPEPKIRARAETKLASGLPAGKTEVAAATAVQHP